jgi:hypothetical protein
MSKLIKNMDWKIKYLATLVHDTDDCKELKLNWEAIKAFLDKARDIIQGYYDHSRSDMQFCGLNWMAEEWLQEKKD